MEEIRIGSSPHTEKINCWDRNQFGWLWNQGQFKRERWLCLAPIFKKKMRRYQKFFVCLFWGAGGVSVVARWHQGNRFPLLGFLVSLIKGFKNWLNRCPKTTILESKRKLGRSNRGAAAAPWMREGEKPCLWDSGLASQRHWTHSYKTRRNALEKG